MSTETTEATRTKPPARRRSQEERSTETRGRLLDAAVECLIEFGYSSTTTATVAERAGVSRGAQLHHYPTRVELLTAAIEHLSVRMGHQLAEEATRLAPRGDRPSAAANTLLRAIRDPLFVAWVELRVAARTDPELRVALVPVERRLWAAVSEMLRRLFGDVAAQSRGYDDLVALSIPLLQGLLLERAVSTESPRARQERESTTVEAWKRLVVRTLSE
jgi:AcrR family transcriptional regulator